MDARYWGFEADKEACEALRLDVSTHTIFMASITADHVPDDRLDEMADMDVYMEPSEFIELMQERRVDLWLPAGFFLVGVMPITGEGEARYGIVNLAGKIQHAAAATPEGER